MAVNVVTGDRAAELKAKLLSQVSFRTSNGGERNYTDWERFCDGGVREKTFEEFAGDAKKLQFAKSNFLHSLKMQARKRGKVVYHSWIKGCTNEDGTVTPPLYQVVVVPPRTRKDFDYLEKNEDSKNVPPRPAIYEDEVGSQELPTEEPNEEVVNEQPAEQEQPVEEEAPVTHKNGNGGKKGKPARLHQPS